MLHLRGMIEPLLHIKNLRTEFKTESGTVAAVNGIDLAIMRGEAVGIVGESGSGKSVTALSVMRLIQSPGKVTAGEAWFCSSEGEAAVDVLALRESDMRAYRGRHLAMIFQEPMTSLNPVLTCGFQVEEAILLHTSATKSEARSQTIALFERVQLSDPNRIYAAYPHQLSGGQKQRVMIAMAMSCNPSLLIADEPTTALDVTVQRTILQLMADLRRELGTAVLFITHDLGVVADIADRVAVMYKGQIVEIGAVAEVFKNPKHPYTKALLACRPPTKYRLRKLPVVSDFMTSVQQPDGSWHITEKPLSVGEAVAKHRIESTETGHRLAQLEAKGALMQVTDLRVWFPKTRNIWGRTTDYIKAVEEVSFEVYAGETLGLVGESGSGKTTLGRALLGLQATQGGKVLYQGQNLLELGPAAWRDMRRRIQIIFQDPYASLNPRMTVGAAITEPMTVHRMLGSERERRDRTMELLEIVGLDAEHVNRFPHEFSGGQRQRVAIARALSVNPEFIICDESVAALDVSVQAQVLNLLMELREKFGFTCIFISHDMSVVRFLSDRIIVMNQGRIIEKGTADQVFFDPQQPYTQQLIAAIPKGM